MIIENNFLTDDNRNPEQALFRGIADAVPGMLYIIDLRGMKMVYANLRVLDLFGQTLADLTAMGPTLFDRYVFPLDRPKFDAHIAELLSSAPGYVAELTFRLLNAKGEPTWLRTRRTIFQWDDEGKPTHVISISQDISAEIELLKTNERLARERQLLKEEKDLEVVRAVLSKQEEERNRISESLHNGLGQLLYGIKLSVSGLSPNPTNEFLHQKKYALQLLEEAISQTRQLSHQLIPIILNDFGLKAAIEDSYQKMKTGIRFSLQMTEGKQMAPQYIELAIFRIVQELILNVCKHSAAQTCHVKIDIEERQVQIVVADNGKGIPNHPTDGIGLRSVRDRVSLLKGEIDIQSQPGNTTIRINIPYRPEPK